MHTSVKLNTIGTISAQLGIPVHRVRYLLHTRGIAPESVAGPAYVYGDAAVKQLQQELQRGHRLEPVGVANS